MEIAAHSVSHQPAAVTSTGYIKRFLPTLMNAPDKMDYLRQAAGTLRGMLSRPKSPDASTAIPVFDGVREAAKSRRELEEHTGAKVTSYVYPYGRSNQTYRDGVRAAGYTSARGTLSGYNNGRDDDLFDLKSMAWEPDMAVKHADNWVTGAVRRQAWLIETLHLVTDEASTCPYTTSLRDFRRHVENVLSRYNLAIWLSTQAEAVHYISLRQCTVVSLTVVNDRSIDIKLTATSPDNLTGELTLKLTVPADWNEVEIRQNDSPFPFTRTKNEVIFNATVNGSVISVRPDGPAHD
jgi:hypothetical protein